MSGWGVVDDFLGFLNWLDLVEGWIRGWGAGDVVGHRIALPSPTGVWWEENADVRPWSLNEVRRLLDGYHIANYARGFDSREIWIHVPEHQARWAEYLLLRAGAPVIMDVVDPNNTQWAANPAHGGRLPDRWDDRD